MRWFAIVMLMLFPVAQGGCAAVKATEQPPKRNLSVLESGVARTHVIAELGAPTWSDEREGETVDVFKFKQGYAKETKAVRALAHGAADVATLGLWEVVGIPFESIADGTDVQVEVHYGQDQMVSSVNVIKGDHVVHPEPNLLARTFGGKHTRPDPAGNKVATRSRKTSRRAKITGENSPDVLPDSDETMLR